MKILVLGAGALGSWVASILAGDNSVTVLDYDRVEDRNIAAGTQYYRRDQVGLFKVEALQYNIYKDLGKKIDIINQKLDEDTKAILEGDWDLIVDCFDNHFARSLVHNNSLVNTLHVGMSPQRTLQIAWDEIYEPPTDYEEGFDICQMQGARGFVLFVSGLASNVVGQYIKNGDKESYVGSEKYLKQIL